MVNWLTSSAAIVSPEQAAIQRFRGTLQPQCRLLNGDSGAGVLRRFEPHQSGLLGDALDDAVHQAAKVEELTTDNADIDDPYYCNDGRYERPAEY